MNIRLLHYTAPPIVGGVENVMGHQARLMAAAGHQVIILAGRGEQITDNIPFISIPLADSRHPAILTAKAVLDRGLIPENFETLVGDIETELLKHLSNVDVLIAHNVCSLNKNLALTAALKRISTRPHSPRLVIWHHDLAWTTPRYQNEVYDAYPWNLLKSNWPGAVQVTISEARRLELAALLQIAPDKIKVVPNGVDPDSFLKLEKTSRELLERLDLLKASPLFLLPVRITPRKNIELAIRILAELRASHYPAATLVVTGPLGPHNPANLVYFERLIQLRNELGLKRAIIFLAEEIDESLPDAVIADFYQLCDALLLPSQEEGFGIPILEAGLAGCPVFCSDIPPLRELGDSSVVYFSTDDAPSTIANRITEHLAHNLTFALRQRVKQQFTWRQIFNEAIQPILSDQEKSS
jgi:mannosylglucosylglycerate synthase